MRYRVTATYTRKFFWTRDGESETYQLCQSTVSGLDAMREYAHALSVHYLQIPGTYLGTSYLHLPLERALARHFVRGPVQVFSVHLPVVHRNATRTRFIRRINIFVEVLT